MAFESAYADFPSGRPGPFALNGQSPHILLSLDQQSVGRHPCQTEYRFTGQFSVPPPLDPLLVLPALHVHASAARRCRKQLMESPLSGYASSPARGRLGSFLGGTLATPCSINFLPVPGDPPAVPVVTWL